MTQPTPAALRKVYYEAWQKALNNQALSDIEIILVDVIQRHPEYQDMLANEENYKQHENANYALDQNPFFHLALHVAIIEQVNSDRPVGTKAVYQQLLKKHQDKTIVEHKMVDCLTLFLNDTGSDLEKRYIEQLKKL